MDSLYERLAVSLVDDLSYSLNDVLQFYKMIKSAKGLPEAKHQNIIRITDADKRSAAFVIEKMKAIAGVYTQKSENFVRMIECPLDYDNPTGAAGKLMVYLWKENSGAMQYLVRSYNEWHPSERKSRNFSIPMPNSPTLLDLVWRMDTWEEHSLLEQDIGLDIGRRFPDLKRTQNPSIRLPVNDFYRPVTFYEGIMEYNSDRDSSGNPLPTVILSSTPRVKKKAATSVQVYGDGARKKTWVTVAFRNK